MQRQRAVTRHQLDIRGSDHEDRAINDGVERGLARVEAHPRRLKNILQSSLRLAGMRSSLDPVAKRVETWQAYVQVTQASSAIFAVATAVEGTVEIRFGDRLLAIPAASTRGIADAGNWVTAFYFAVISRDQARLDMLSKVPIDLLRATGSAFDDYIYHWVETLQAYWSEGPDLAEKLQATYRATDSANARYASQELMLQILYPPIDMFYRYLDEQRDEFNNSLARGLQLHDAFWSSSEDDRRDSRVGMIAAGPLAMACLAFDAEFPIDIESDYLPRHIVQRSWLGEFPTQ